MTLTVLSTGSKANCYLLDNGVETLILDAGVPYGTIARRAVSGHEIAGCLITHEHLDHSRSAKDLLMRGISCYMSDGTANAIRAHGAQTVKSKKLFSVGNTYKVLAFDTQHDSEEPLGFLIKSIPTNENLIYVTDTYYMKYKFDNIDYWIVECNYSDEELIRQVETGRINSILYDRLQHSHMSLKRLKQTLSANDLTTVKKIVLVHLSDQRSDEMRMVQEIEAQTHIETVAAINGECIRLERIPF